MIEFDNDFERPELDEVRAVFDRMDKVAGGGMPVADLREAMAALGVNMTRREVIRAIAEIKDQALNVVQLEDFEHIVSRATAEAVLWDADELTSTQRAPPFPLNRIKRWVDKGDLAKERARPFRRTVFQDSDWKMFRSSYRIIDNLTGFFGKSEVLRGLYLEMAIMLALSTSVWALNTAIASHSIPLLGGLSPFWLPILPYQLSATALALLLVFRTNNSYSRYVTAREQWGGVIDDCVECMRAGIEVLNERRDKEELARRLVTFAHLLKKVTRFGRREEDIARRELTALVGAAEAARLLANKHRPLQALQDVSRIVAESEVNDPFARGRLHGPVGNLIAHCGTIIRLYRGPLPLAYTRFSGRFLAVWLLTLPLAMWKELNGSIMMVPITIVLSAVYFSIDELGIQIEEPYSLLPIEGFCDTIESSVREMLANDVPREERRIGTDVASWD